MKKILLALPLLVAVFSGMAMATECDRFPGKERPHGERPAGPGDAMGPFHGLCFGDPEYLREELKLSPEQIGRIAEINERFRKERETLYRVMKPGRDELRLLLLAENINFDDVRKKLKQISESEIELKILQIRHRLELQKVLTPEQLDMLKREHRNMKHRRMHRDHD